jgi:hypothetical protein
MTHFHTPLRVTLYLSPCSEATLSQHLQVHLLMLPDEQAPSSRAVSNLDSESAFRILMRFCTTRLGRARTMSGRHVPPGQGPYS